MASKKAAGAEGWAPKGEWYQHQEDTTTSKEVLTPKENTASEGEPLQKKQQLSADKKLTLGGLM